MLTRAPPSGRSPAATGDPAGGSAGDPAVLGAAGDLGDDLDGDLVALRAAGDVGCDLVALASTGDFGGELVILGRHSVCDVWNLARTSKKGHHGRFPGVHLPGDPFYFG